MTYSVQENQVFAVWIQETPSNLEGRSWWTAHSSYQYFTSPQAGSKPCDQPDHVRCLHSSRCSWVQGLSSGLILKALLGRRWKGLARWFKSPIPTYPGLKWFLDVQTVAALHGEGGFPGPKRAIHTVRPKSEAVAASWKVETDSAGTEIPRLDTATTSTTSVHVLEKCRLQSKPGGEFYTAMEFHSFFYRYKLIQKGFYKN